MGTYYLSYFIIGGYNMAEKENKAWQDGQGNVYIPEEFPVLSESVIAQVQRAEAATTTFRASVDRSTAVLGEEKKIRVGIRNNSMSYTGRRGKPTDVVVY